MPQKILLVFGTRPEAIKMLPVAQALRQEPSVEVRICVTAQHRQMLDQVLDLFEERPDYDLDVMTHSQGLEQVTTAVLNGLGRVLDDARPDRILVHGDTTTTMAATLAAFYRRVPVAHVEAGLRSGDPLQPWPEEINRRVTDVVADRFFAPTARSRDNLLKENVPAQAIHVTGNTVIDALLDVVERIRRRPDLVVGLERRFAFLDAKRPILLVTGHRRENFGAPFESLCEAIRDLALSQHIQVVYPVHLNPNVQSAVRRVLGGVTHVHLIEPLDYLPFVYLMMRAHVVLTDSGGIQEEAPSLGKPVFVMRNVTERPEAVEAGTVRLVGTDRERIFNAVSEVLADRAAYERMSRAHNPYGDGKASRRIADILTRGQTSEFLP
ncbi:non-hydrolyzing UDP-N-acetylglucosamine 2-epimerase [Blastochloris sulfoviridis]|uniref:UDP-N-acetylglucosamine 2-epimerase (non-hydrolyzing) n=1 Tax=Blastochloris sulfoviridis TaxID=50712 RepID=A0A5M6I413_9HYPH|nr:UDP-N-acetylglucosamine 2-epimerase (non-hydrolyzing) [Blastochloris sulfoviridis]KAA5602528.1 UDP-N-acetylglucosamine 2-epimerase (non-hydrolyzing) [Blastochloris sulfoviridis]